jgi:hypothetical protein
MAVLHNNANLDFMHLIWKIYYYELVTGMEKDIHVSHKGQGAATNREKGQGVTQTRAGAAPCKSGLARTLYIYKLLTWVTLLNHAVCFKSVIQSERSLFLSKIKIHR